MKNRICVVIIFLSAAFLMGCSSETRRIKKALRETIPVELLSQYKLKSYSIIGTLLENNVKDSIIRYQRNKSILEQNIQDQKAFIRLYEKNIEDCRLERSRTLYWLRGSYDNLIDDYQRMIQDAEGKINNDSLLLIHNEERIAFYEKSLVQAQSPIIFYIIQHNYSIDGLNRNERVVLDSDYNLTNIKI